MQKKETRVHVPLQALEHPKQLDSACTPKGKGRLGGCAESCSEALRNNSHPAGSPGVDGAHGPPSTQGHNPTHPSPFLNPLFCPSPGSENHCSSISEQKGPQARNRLPGARGASAMSQLRRVPRTEQAEQLERVARGGPAPSPRPPSSEQRRKSAELYPQATVSLKQSTTGSVTGTLLPAAFRAVGGEGRPRRVSRVS